MNRYQEREAWVSSVLSAQAEIIPLQNDASFRQYFRVYHNGTSYILMDAPPAKESCDSFLAVQALLYSNQIAVPALHAQDRALGFLLLSDMGDAQLLKELNEKTVDGWYRQAIDGIIQLQSIPSASLQQLPHFDQTLLERECELFREWYLTGLCQMTLSATDHQQLDSCFDFLVESMLSQQQAFVHRDYHSRNLMCLPEGGLGMIDFQDAVVGPLAYDLVSLLKDCYIVWPKEKVREWVGYYWQQAKDRGLVLVSEEDFFQDFLVCGIQRHIKVLGIFSRLHLRDGKSTYLHDLPRVRAYLREAILPFPVLQPLYAFIEEREVIA